MKKNTVSVACMQLNYRRKLHKSEIELDRTQQYTIDKR